MKKQLIIYFSITAVLLLCFTGCGRTVEEKENSIEESSVQSQTLIEETGDAAEADHVADSDDTTDSDDVANPDDGVKTDEELSEKVEDGELNSLNQRQRLFCLPRLT